MVIGVVTLGTGAGPAAAGGAAIIGGGAGAGAAGAGAAGVGATAVVATGAEVAAGARGAIPILRQHSCPYYELAETDRSICALERKMFEKVLGRGLKLSQCRLDGDRFCDFEAKPIPSQT